MNRTQVLLAAISVAGALWLIPASAWAAEGWYLLIPPRSDYNERAEYLSGYKILDHKPLSQWAHQAAYDSAAECEGAKQALLLAEHQVYVAHSRAYLQTLGQRGEALALKIQRHAAERSNATVDALTASRCIQSIDPRLLQ